jgi:nucleoside-triphosphatase THEP1
VGEAAIPNESNLLFVCGKADDRTRERFDVLGCAALAKCSARSLLVMDELGPHEAEAALFRQAVLKLLDGDIPILGVLQAPAERFWPEITHHPNVRMLEVTENDRDQKEIIDDIISFLQL